MFQEHLLRLLFGIHALMKDTVSGWKLPAAWFICTEAKSGLNQKKKIDLHPSFHFPSGNRPSEAGISISIHFCVNNESDVASVAKLLL